MSDIVLVILDSVINFYVNILIDICNNLFISDLSLFNDWLNWRRDWGHWWFNVNDLRLNNWSWSSVNWHHRFLNFYDWHGNFLNFKWFLNNWLWLLNNFMEILFVSTWYMIRNNIFLWAWSSLFCILISREGSLDTSDFNWTLKCWFWLNIYRLFLDTFRCWWVIYEFWNLILFSL